MALSIPEQVYAEVLCACDFAKLPAPPQLLAETMISVAAELWNYEVHYIKTLEADLLPAHEAQALEAVQRNVEERSKRSHAILQPLYDKLQATIEDIKSTKAGRDATAAEIQAISNWTTAHMQAIEKIDSQLPEIPLPSYLTQARTIQHGTAKQRIDARQNIPTLFIGHLSKIFVIFLDYIFTLDMPRGNGGALPIMDIVDKDVRIALSDMWAVIRSDPKCFPTLATDLMSNYQNASKNLPGDCFHEYAPLKPRNLVEKFLGITPLRALFEASIPMPEAEPEPDPTVPDIEDRYWYQHCLLLAQTRGGKTNVIRWRISNLLQQIAKGQASLILMEPKGPLTEEVLSLAYIHEWLRDRLIIIDPNEPSVSVNIFDKGDGSPFAVNEAINRVQRVLNTITADLTPFQREALTFALRAMFSIPGRGTLRTVVSILRRGIADLPTENLSETVREFFEHDFEAGKGQSQQIISRLNGLLANPMFESLFAAERSTLDLFKEIQAGKLIVICASKANQTYGSFWIEEVNSCIASRYALPYERRTPTTVILDEAQTWISEDLHFADILDRAAEARIGMIIAMHHMGQITDTQVRGSIYTNTTLKFAARSTEEIHSLCRAMGNPDTEFLTNLPQHQFAYFGPDMDAPTRVKFPLVDFTTWPKMTPEQSAELREANRRKYAYRPNTGTPAPEPTPQPEPVSTDELSLADAYAQLALAIRRGNTERAAELRDHIASHEERMGPPPAQPEEGGSGWR